MISLFTLSSEVGIEIELCGSTTFHQFIEHLYNLTTVLIVTKQEEQVLMAECTCTHTDPFTENGGTITYLELGKSRRNGRRHMTHWFMTIAIAFHPARSAPCFLLCNLMAWPSPPILPKETLGIRSLRPEAKRLASGEHQEWKAAWRPRRPRAGSINETQRFPAEPARSLG